MVYSKGNDMLDPQLDIEPNHMRSRSFFQSVVDGVSLHGHWKG
jgi:hypothetical protein